MGLDEVIKVAVSRAGIVRVRNALNPFLWGFVWSIVFAILTYLFRDDSAMKYVCLGLSAIPMLTALGIGVGFAIKAPDRLQSEEYVIRQQELRQNELKIRYKHGAAPEILDVTKNVEHIEREWLSNDAGEDE